MKIPDTSIRAHQLDLCIERRTNFLSYYVKDNELSLPERMKDCNFIEIVSLIGWEDSVLKELKNLTKLHVKGYEYDFQSIDWLTIEFLTEIPNLEELKLEECWLSDEKDIQNRLAKIKKVEIIK